MAQQGGQGAAGGRGVAHAARSLGLISM
jgi:hypothetical protein